jgi:hypothetical protein
MKSTQIYLTPGEHEALQREADRLGCSMTAVIRSLVDRHLLGADSGTDLTDLAGSLHTSLPTDIAADKDRLLYEDLRDDLHRHERAVRVAES